MLRAWDVLNCLIRWVIVNDRGWVRVMIWDRVRVTVRDIVTVRVRVSKELSGRYTVRCNLAEIVIQGSSYKDSEP